METDKTVRVSWCIWSLALSLLLVGGLAGCGSARWEPADSGDIPLIPRPKDSIESAPDDGFGDEAGEDDLISREILFGNPTRAAARISPDGKRLAFLAPDDGVLNVWVASAAEPAKAKVVTHDRKRGIRRFFWAHTSEDILYLQDKGGDENWRVYSVSLANEKEQDLTPLEGVRAEVQQLSYKHPTTILVGLNDRDKKYHDIYSIDIRSGERKLLQKNERYGGFVCDEDLQVRLAVEPNPDGGQRFLRKVGTKFVPFIEVSMEDALTTSPAGFDQTGKVLYMLDSRGRDTSALVKLKLPIDKAEVIAHDPKADVSDVLMHPTENRVLAVASNRLRSSWKFLDPEVEKDFAVLQKLGRGDVQITSQSLDNRRWTVALAPDDGPMRFYLYDRDSHKATFLFVHRPELEGLGLARMRPLEIPSRDGLSLVSYLTLPAGIDGEIPDSPLPMVLFVHGGPWSRDEWGYNPYHQWLANRGYAVLSVNYRGSTGFGKAFINAGNYEWAGKMHDDLIDAVKWAIDRKIAQPDKVAIMGGSYGGYATLVGLTFTPTTFACGVDIVGPSSLVTLLQSIPPYWEPFIAQFKKRVGDHTTEEGKKGLLARSPLTRISAIARPLLIGQGANDPRVKQAEADQIVAAMKAKNIPVTYVLYPDEGHGFARPENRKSFNAVAEAFLAGCLGGKAQSVGEDFVGSSIEVPAGVAGVKGLQEALGAR